MKRPCCILQRLIILTTFMGSAALLRADLFSSARPAACSTRGCATRIAWKGAAQNEKLASMGRMVASIAHEIRNPLGIIRSSAELLLKRQKAEGGTNVKMLEAIFHESKRLSQTVNDFLDYARPRQPRPWRMSTWRRSCDTPWFLTREGQGARSDGRELAAGGLCGPGETGIFCIGAFTT